MHFESANKEASKAINKVRFGGASRRQKEQQSSVAAVGAASAVAQRTEVGALYTAQGASVTACKIVTRNTMAAVTAILD